MQIRQEKEFVCIFELNNLINRREWTPELLAFQLAAQEVVEYAELLGQGQRHLILS